MTTPPTKQELISLVESMCEVQDRMLGDEAEKNRAEWRKFIKEHRNDDVFQG